MLAMEVENPPIQTGEGQEAKEREEPKAGQSADTAKETADTGKGTDAATDDIRLAPNGGEKRGESAENVAEAEEEGDESEPDSQSTPVANGQPEADDDGGIRLAPNAKLDQGKRVYAADFLLSFKNVRHT